jgi:hypothetical protein
MTDPTPAEPASDARLTVVVALLVVIAAGVWTIAIVDVMNRKDTKRAAKAVAEAVDEWATYTDCLADEGSTVAECDAAFPDEAE